MTYSIDDSFLDNELFDANQPMWAAWARRVYELPVSGQEQLGCRHIRYLR